MLPKEESTNSIDEKTFALVSDIVSQNKLESLDKWEDKEYTLYQDCKRRGKLIREKKQKVIDKIRKNRSLWQQISQLQDAIIEQYSTLEYKETDLDIKQRWEQLFREKLSQQMRRT